MDLELSRTLLWPDVPGFIALPEPTRAMDA